MVRWLDAVIEWQPRTPGGSLQEDAIDLDNTHVRGDKDVRVVRIGAPGNGFCRVSTVLMPTRQFVLIFLVVVRAMVADS